MPLDRKRLGNCYELAGKYQLDRPDRELTLVHGTTQSDPRPPNPHGWIEYEDDYDWPDRWMVWEPVSNEVMPRSVFYATFNATEHHRYTREEVAKLALRHKHWGPWEGDYWQLGDRKKVVANGEGTQ